MFISLPPDFGNILSYMARDFINVIKLRTLSWGDYPGLSR